MYMHEHSNKVQYHSITLIFTRMDITQYIGYNLHNSFMEILFHTWYFHIMVRHDLFSRDMVLP